VIGLQRFVDISTGFGSHSCGVTTQGNLYCWGLGSSGQRGDGTSRGAVSTPLRVVEPPPSP
jgi:alpha-tubulin suppressor-like RCC1 family protein